MLSAIAASLLACVTPANSGAQSLPSPGTLPSGQMAALAVGAIHGIVRDDSGAPVAGATVSALGDTPAFTTTDRSGRYEMRPLSPGSYAVRAHQAGYTASRTHIVQVRPNSRTAFYIAVRRTTTAPKVLAAEVGVAVAAAPDPESAAASAEAGPEGGISEVAWRIRHPERRSVLKSSSLPGALFDGEGSRPTFGFKGLGSAAEASARLAASFFANAPWSGEVNFLTSGSFDSPEQLFSFDAAPRGVAYLSLGAPVGSADWTVRGALTQADISSWVLAGSYRERQTEGHQYHLGLSYSTQRYHTGNPLVLRDDVTNGSRSVGELFGFDTVSLTPAVSVNYGARYARYDYLAAPNLVSPRVKITVLPGDHVRIKTLVSRRALAPGAEEFLPPRESAIWLPPQRTFSAAEPGRPLVPEYTTHAGVELERDLGRSTVGLRAFHQRIEEQLITIFGAIAPDHPAAKLGHYRVASGGDLQAIGGAASIDTIFSRWVRGGLEYAVTNARLPDGIESIAWFPESVAFMQLPETIHDISASIEADVPETSTRVSFLYRASNAFARAAVSAGSLPVKPVLDSRFDLQVRQALPFMDFAPAKWEMLLAVRNFFREPAPDQSVYDELLVVRPPTQVVGGVSLLF
jgi:hypothetical protein